MTGMTIKQFNRQHFFDCLQAYKEALTTGKNLTIACILIHSAQGMDGVPKYFKRYITQAEKEVEENAQQKSIHSV